jgi:HEAT repeat protein
MLWFVWSLSIVLGLLSLAVMIVLIGRRVVRQRAAATNASARRKLHSSLIAFSQDRDRDALKRAIGAAPPHVALGAGFEFLGLLRGEEHDEVVSMLLECGLADEVASSLKTGNEAERIHAIEMLAALRPESAVANLLSTLDFDKAREVRIAAAIALCDIGSLPPLSITLRKIGVAGQRSRRLIELFRRFPPQRIAELRDHARRVDVTPFVKAAVIDALARTGDPRLADFFAQTAADPSPDVAAAAVRALGRVGHPDAAAIVIEAMASHDWGVRADAAEAAGNLAIAAAAGSLTRLLDDEAWTVRYAAAKALRSLGASGHKALREIAENQMSRSQRAASLVLAEGPVEP